MRKKKFINFTIAVFLVFGLVLIFGKREWFPDFYNPHFMGIASFMSALAVILPKFIFRSKDFKKQEAVLNLQAIFSAALLLNGTGSLGLYKLYLVGFEYDKAVHFLVPFFLFIAITNFAGDWYGLNSQKILVFSGIFILIGGFIWEFLEAIADIFLKTQTMGFYGQEIIKDTIVDNVFNFLGIIAGFCFQFFKKRAV
ncbi:hypothetical protein HY838_02105 [Candidatus Azambacteria bacterium]|nr:hypothetical protein [Candidatus Azambacteria bacterium]